MDGGTAVYVGGGLVEGLILLIVGVVLWVMSGPLGAAITGEAGKAVGIVVKVIGIILVIVGIIFIILAII
jgi:hypothetical protein